MKQMNISTRRKTERGAALLLVMFAIILVSGFGILMYFSSGTESRIDANYGSSLNAYYAARFGIEEVRARVKYSTLVNPPQPGITLPSDIAGNANGVLYFLNPASGENVDPTDINNRYFDDQLCHDFNSGVPRGAQCTVTPTVGNWNMQSLPSLAGAGDATPFKWARVNMKTNRISDPYFVDATNLPASLDTRVCWDGTNEQLSPGGANPACDANGMQTVYMLTALAVTPGVAQTAGRKLLRSELVAPSIRPPGAVTMDAASASPVLSDGGIPTTAIDGRVHTLAGILGDPTTNRCSSVAAVATDNPQTSTQIAQQLDGLRQNIVNAAASSCNADGSSIAPNNCTPGLWWVRGTDLLPRYSINPAGAPAPTPTPIPTPTPVPTPTPTGGGGDDHGHHGGSSGGSGSSSGTTGTGTGTTGTGTGTTGTGTGTAGSTGTLSGVPTACDPGIASCYANLDLTAPELLAVSATMAPHVPSVVVPDNPSSPFTGGSGNSLDPAIYQTQTDLANTLPNQVKTLSTLVGLSTGQPNYILTSVANLAQSYGNATNPAIVVITDSTGLKLPKSLTHGFGVLVVPSDFEINGVNFQWTGIVLVQGGSAQFVVGAGATGFINGSLMLQPAHRELLL